MRALPQEIQFAKFLLDVGDGKLNDSDDVLNIDHFPPNCIIPSEVDIVDDIYGNIFAKKEYRKSINYAILSARNADVKEINERVVNLLDKTTEKVYTSIDSTENCDNAGFDNALLSIEYLNIWSPPSLPPYELKLRLNCVVILIRNLNAIKKGEIIFINRITLYSSETDYPFIFKRRQFSIKVAFAMTINKAQGQTFEKIGIDLRRAVFNHGQLYVALSRVRGWNSIRIYLDDSEKKDIYATRKTPNLIKRYEIRT
ncbi:uncharacterized protein LOC116738693 [Nasonia vitripennis]|uniref:ATP-dependent DNA helicase n=1 Tax=Nasonia vitripennis TaxID=7425 RepID=A0A7M7R3S4_NASVI|nr:uncharacterized protein LOC116738693 [Nasonia vitripennis]